MSLMDHVGRVRLAERFATEARRAFPQQVERIILFGSVARGDDREDSDIDVLVLWNGDRKEGRKSLIALAVKLMLDTGEYVSAKVLTPEAFAEGQRDPSPFLEAVLAEGKALA